MAELKPCPFCGGIAKTHACAELDNEALKIIYSGKYGTHCSVCNVATLPYPSEEEAIEAWNKRAESEELQFTRKFIHEHGLDFALASAWQRRVKDAN